MNFDIPVGALSSLPLASVRSLALFTTAPIFGHSAVPVRIRVVLGLAFALVAAPLAATPQLASNAPVLELGGMIANEALVGVSLGFGLRVVFALFAPLGELISLQGGLGAASALDPASGAASPVLGVLLQLVGLVVFLAIDGHHELLRGLAASFERIPVGNVLWSGDAFSRIVGMGASLYEVTARLAAPVTAVMVLSNVGVGILGRAIPQLNLMALQLPAHIAVVLLILGLAAGPLSEAIAQVLSEGTTTAIEAVVGD